MSNQDTKLIRESFGRAIRSFRTHQSRRISQTALCNMVNTALLTNKSPVGLYQKKLSRIERGDMTIILPRKTIKELQRICSLSDEVVEPYIELMNDIQDGQEEDAVINPVHIEEYGQLLAKPNHSEFKGYIGDYYCYFYSTDSKSPKIVKGRMRISVNDLASCAAEVIIYEKGHVIKQYAGQFVINQHYQMWHCILVGRAHQEVCLLTSSHFISAIKENLLSMAVVLTASAGMRKRPTMHRMLISRSKINNKTLKLIQSQLMLNTDVITISEEKLYGLEQSVAEKEQQATGLKEKAQYEAVLACINYIKSNAKKTAYYQIEESIIYDSMTIADDSSLRSFVVATLRNNSDEKFYNKISQTVQDICMNIIKDKI